MWRVGGQQHVLLSPCIPWYTDGGQGHVLNTLYLSASESVKKQAQYKKYLKMKSETVVSLRKQEYQWNWWILPDKQIIAKSKL